MHVLKYDPYDLSTQTGAAVKPFKLEDIIPISEFKANVAKHVRRIAAIHAPLVVTQGGKAAFVVMSAEDFAQLQQQLALVDDLIESGLDFEEGRVLSTDEVLIRARKRLTEGALAQEQAG